MTNVIGLLGVVLLACSCVAPPDNSDKYVWDAEKERQESDKAFARFEQKNEKLRQEAELHAQERKRIEELSHWSNFETTQEYVEYSIAHSVRVAFLYSSDPFTDKMTMYSYGMTEGLIQVNCREKDVIIEVGGPVLAVPNTVIDVLLRIDGGTTDNYKATLYRNSYSKGVLDVSQRVAKAISRKLETAIEFNIRLDSGRNVYDSRKKVFANMRESLGAINHFCA